MAVKLHRCPLVWLKGDFHACHRVQKALDDMGVEYSLVKEPLSRGKREWVSRATGQERLPVIEFEDGSTYREESKDMKAKILAGRLFEGRAAGGGDPGAESPGA